MIHEELFIRCNKHKAGTFYLVIEGKFIPRQGGSVYETVTPDEIRQAHRAWGTSIEQDHARPAEPTALDGELLRARLMGQIRASQAGFQEEADAFHEAGDPSESLRTRLALETDELRRLDDLLCRLIPGRAMEGIERYLAWVEARPAERGLRVILDVAADAQEMLLIPWELLRLPTDSLKDARQQGRKRFLFLNRTIILVRQVRTVGSGRPITLDGARPPQVFLAQPADGDPIQAEAFFNPLKALFEPGTPETADAWRQERSWWYSGDSTLRELQRRLMRHSPQMLQIICHGTRRAHGAFDEIDLVLTYDDGFSHRVNVDEDTLGLLPVWAPDLQIALLAICDSTGGEINNLALNLVRSGVPIVIGMQGRIIQTVAAEFSAAFYRRLQAGASFEAAVAEARIAAYDHKHPLDWAIPVIYQGSKPADGRPFAGILERATSIVFGGAFGRRLRLALNAAMVILIPVSLLHWLGGLAAQPASLAALRQASLIWAGIGLIAPPVISWRLPSPPVEGAILRRRIKRTQRAGAYLGYALGGWTAFAATAAVFYGAGGGLPAPLWWGCFAGMLAASLAFAAIGGLSQSYSARDTVHESAALHKSFFDYPGLYIIYLAALILIGVPLGVFSLAWLTEWMRPLLKPGPGGILLALAVLKLNAELGR